MKSWVVVVAGVLSLVSCQQAQVSGIRVDPSRAWVATEPIQCLGNPWEQDWLASHGGNYAAYPRNPATPGLEPAEVEIIKDYYRRQGVVVLAVVVRTRFQAVCAACSCPEGYTLYLAIRRQDVYTMISLGFRQESP